MPDEPVPPLRPSSLVRDRRRGYLSIAVSGALFVWLFLLYRRFLYLLSAAALGSLWGLLYPLGLAPYIPNHVSLLAYAGVCVLALGLVAWAMVRVVRGTGGRLALALAPCAALALAPDFPNPVFRSPLAFVGSYLLGLGLVAWTMVRVVTDVRERLGLAVCAALALAYPLLLPWDYGEYRMPVVAADGYELRWITEPGNRYSSALRQAQLAHGGEAGYRLLGWSSDGVLYLAGGGVPGVRSYDPATGHSRWLLSLIGCPGVNGAAVEPAGGAVYLPQPASLVGPAHPLLTLERAPSPDGEWEAFTVRWYYGPSEVVMVRRAE